MSLIRFSPLDIFLFKILFFIKGNKSTQLHHSILFVSYFWETRLLILIFIFDLNKSFLTTLNWHLNTFFWIFLFNILPIVYLTEINWFHFLLALNFLAVIFLAVNFLADLLPFFRIQTSPHEPNFSLVKTGLGSKSYRERVLCVCESEGCDSHRIYKEYYKLFIAFILTFR